MEGYELARIIIFISGMLVGIGLFLGIIAAIIFFFEDDL